MAPPYQLVVPTTRPRAATQRSRRGARDRSGGIDRPRALPGTFPSAPGAGVSSPAGGEM